MTMKSIGTIIGLLTIFSGVFWIIVPPVALIPVFFGAVTILVSISHEKLKVPSVIRNHLIVSACIFLLLPHLLIVGGVRFIDLWQTSSLVARFWPKPRSVYLLPVGF